MTFTVDSFTMCFGHRKVLSDVFLSTRNGEVFGLLGRNGSGKSTLFKCLLGLHASSSGSMRLDGKWISRSIALNYFAYLPQLSYLPLDLKLRKSVDLLLPRGHENKLIRDDLDVHDLLDRTASSLSYGQRRYIECLIALSSTKPIVLLDEPFSQVDPLFCSQLRRYILEASVSRLVLVTDHLYWNIKEICTKIAVIGNGTLHMIPDGLEGLKRYGYLSDSDMIESSK